MVNKMNITAIIVTYNRDSKLKASIDSLYKGLRAPDNVVIVNNASTDNTQTVIDELCVEYSSIHVVQSKKNIGGAGGFCLGLAAAYKIGATHFWIMDDDGLAVDSSLSNLVRGYETLNAMHKVGFVCSKVDWIDGNICEMNQPETSWNWMRVYKKEEPYIQIQACSFVSCFFSRDILEESGLPLKDFFIWFDDSEFTRRLSRNYPCFAILDSVVIHDTPINQGVYFGAVNDANIWKYSYGAANEAWYRFKKESVLHGLLFVTQKNIDMHRGKVSYKNRLKINKKFISGVLTSHKIQKVQDFKLEDYTVNEK